MNMNMNLAQRDMRLFQIEQEIMNRKRLIIRKSKRLKKKTKVNEFLMGVKDDYVRYYNYITNEKEQQIVAMELLHKYLDDLKKTEHLADTELRHVEHDQKQILSEMGKFKKELDEIVNES